MVFKKRCAPAIDDVNVMNLLRIQKCTDEVLIVVSLDQDEVGLGK